MSLASLASRAIRESRAAKARFCFLEGTPIARLIVFESVLRNDRDFGDFGDFAPLADTAAAGGLVPVAGGLLGIDSRVPETLFSTGVGGICGFRGVSLGSRPAGYTSSTL